MGQKILNLIGKTTAAGKETMDVKDQLRLSVRYAFWRRGYLASVDIIEALTGLDFFPKLPDEIEQEIECIIQIKLWE